jgi:hypothetical protein
MSRSALHFELEIRKTTREWLLLLA